jgi:hypothetical protein
MAMRGLSEVALQATSSLVGTTLSPNNYLFTIFMHLAGMALSMKHYPAGL